jgi:hypothetical protein
MCSIWKDHPMASIFVLYTIVSCRLAILMKTLFQCCWVTWHFFNPIKILHILFWFDMSLLFDYFTLLTRWARFLLWGVILPSWCGAGWFIVNWWSLWIHWADMPDHDRWSSHAHLLPRVLMNTRRRARGFRGQAKPSMMIFVELQKLLKTWLITMEGPCFLWSTYLWSPLLFMHDGRHVWKVLEVVWSVDREPLAFCMR